MINEDGDVIVHRMRIGSVYEIKRDNANGGKNSIVGWTATITGRAPADDGVSAYWCVIKKGTKCRGGVILSEWMFHNS